MTSARPWTLLFLIGANLAPLYLVLFDGWTVLDVLMLFWLENLIIGALNVLKLATCQPLSLTSWLSRILLTPFFIAHYGGFALGHGYGLLALFSDPATLGLSGFSPALIPTVIEYFDLALPATFLIISHGVSFIVYYLIGAGYQRENPMLLMIKPYGRVVFLHIGIIVGAIALHELGNPLIGLVILVLFKILIDGLIHWRVHQRNIKSFQHFLKNLGPALARRMREWVINQQYRRNTAAKRNPR